jgi:hypothetical protein
VSAVTPDGLLFEGEPYSILRRSTSASFFEPGDFGIETEMLHTGAYRGFVCTYAVEDNSLLLHTLEIRSRDRRYPYIYETRPSFPDYLDDTDPQELEVAPDIPKGTENFEMAYDLSMGTARFTERFSMLLFCCYFWHAGNGNIPHSRHTGVFSRSQRP